MILYRQNIQQFHPVHYTEEQSSRLNNLILILQMNQELQIWLPYLDHAPLFTLMCVKPFNETPF